MSRISSPRASSGGGIDGMLRGEGGRGSSDRVSDLIRGVDTLNDPSTGGTKQLDNSGGYNHFTDGFGNYRTYDNPKCHGGKSGRRRFMDTHGGSAVFLTRITRNGRQIPKSSRARLRCPLSNLQPARALSRHASIASEQHRPVARWPRLHHETRTHQSTSAPPTLAGALPRL
jgi:hypothetical protein